MSTREIPSEVPVPEALRWYYYIPLCGPEGRAWSEGYERANGWDVAARLDHIIAICRRNRVDEARAMLTGCLDDLRAAERSATPAVVSVMRRWCLSTEAYLCYHLRDFTRTRQLLTQSAEAISDAIAQAPFLVGLAAGCAELTVHHARMARDERDWGEMHRLFAKARSMYGNRQPLCDLENGRSIFRRDIDEFVGSLEPRNDEERDSLAFILNPAVLASGIEMLIRRVEANPNVVVPFE